MTTGSRPMVNHEALIQLRKKTQKARKLEQDMVEAKKSQMKKTLTLKRPTPKKESSVGLIVMLVIFALMMLAAVFTDNRVPHAKAPLPAVKLFTK